MKNKSNDTLLWKILLVIIIIIWLTSCALFSEPGRYYKVLIVGKHKPKASYYATYTVVPVDTLEILPKYYFLDDSLRYNIGDTVVRQFNLLNGHGSNP